MRWGQGPNQEHTGSKQGPKLVKRHVNKPYTKGHFTKLDWAGGAMAHVGLNVAPPLLELPLVYIMHLYLFS